MLWFCSPVSLNSHKGEMLRKEKDGLVLFNWVHLSEGWQRAWVRQAMQVVGGFAGGWQ